MRICIVGHGPSTKGRKLGPEIDAHDIVIRHVECDWQDAEDYGSRYDIGIFCPDPLWQAAEAEKVPEFYWKYDPKNKCKDEPIWTTFRDVMCFNLRTKVNPLINGRHFSRGTAAVIGAVLWAKADEISLVGFDAVTSGKFNENHHPEELTRLLKTRKKIGKGLNLNTHDWAKEKQLLADLAEEFNVQINPL